MKIGAIIRKAIYLALMIGILIVLAVLKNNVDIAEIMSRTAMRGYGNAISKVSSFIPFLSLPEIHRRRSESPADRIETTPDLPDPVSDHLCPQ